MMNQQGCAGWFPGVWVENRHDGKLVVSESVVCIIEVSFAGLIRMI